jgi:hypothetical protein
VHTGGSFLGVKWPGCEADLSLVVRLRMKGAISPFPVHVFMACVSETLSLPFSNRKSYIRRTLPIALNSFNFK